MLYQNDMTWEKTLIPVRQIDAAGYNSGVALFEQVGDPELVLADSRDIDAHFDPNVVLRGRPGLGTILTETQAKLLRDKNAAIRAERQAMPAPSVNPILLGTRCHSCGKPRRGRGECSHCGDDTRY